MIIVDALPRGKEAWNDFICKHYPPIGAFMQSWEWGEFQKNMGREIERRYVMENNEPSAAFMYARHALPLGMSYNYAPRGPVIARTATPSQINEIFKTIEEWAHIHLVKDIFLRLEPPLETMPEFTIAQQRKFHIPPLYIQPRYNVALSLEITEDEMRANLHSSTRSNLNRAKRRGVTITHAREFTPETRIHFEQMMKNTIQRNSGVNAYPGAQYFEVFLKTIPFFTIIHGWVNNEPAATHIVLNFGKTATYLYGAAYTKHLSSKVTTMLHFESAVEAQRRGMHYYDIGGIDEKRWPTLTEFKRQFHGKEFAYIGTIDLVLKPLQYALYNTMKKWRG